MAEEKTSGPDYGLGSSTLSQYRRALESEGQTKLGGIAEGLGKLGEKITARQEKMVGLEQEWDDAFSAMGNRGSWASPELYDQFQQMESDYKDEYLKAVRSGNKQQQNKLLKDQELRSTSLQAWKTASEASKELYDDNLYAKNSLTPIQKNMLAQIHDQSNAKIRMNDETGEMEFTISDTQGNPRNVTLREFQKLMETSVMPEKLRLELQQQDQQITNYALQGGVWDDKQQASAMANNKRRINKDKIRTYFYEDITGTDSTFAKDILAHKDFEGVDLNKLAFGMDAKFNDAAGEDGILTTEEFEDAALTMEDRELIVQEMLKPENFDIAQMYLADYMTRKQKQSYDRGVAMRGNVKRNDKGEIIDNEGNVINFGDTA